MDITGFFEKMLPRTRKLMLLAKQDERIMDRLDISRHETTKPSSKPEMLQYIKTLGDSILASKTVPQTRDFDDISSKIVTEERNVDKDDVLQTKSRSSSNENFQSALQEPNLEKVDLEPESGMQEPNIVEGMAMVDCTIEPPPLYYFNQNENGSTSTKQPKSLPEIVFAKNVVSDSVEAHTTIRETVNYDKTCGEESDSDSLVTSDGDEYIPSEVSDDTSSVSSKRSYENSWHNMLLEKAVKDSKIKKSSIKKAGKKPVFRPLRVDNDKYNSARFLCSSDEDTVKISCSTRRDGKRIRNKRYCCSLCQKIVINLSRHLITMHSDDTAVARILALPKGSKHRREEFGKLTREGNFYHNCEVLQMKQGELILLRRPTPLEQKKYTYINYGPCPDCLGFMLKKNIAYHMKNNCTAKSKLGLEARKPISESNAMLAGMFGQNLTTDFTSNILIRMRDDEITKICKEDQLILRFGFMMYEKYSTTQSELIRQSMRQIGRFLIEVKRTCPDVTSLSGCLKPQYFDVAIQSTKALCVTKVNPAKRTEFQTPSLALKIGHALKKCVSYERGNALRSGNIKRNRELESFLSLMDMEWSTRISSNALNTLHVRKFNCTQLLPITSDLIKLNNYLESEIKKCKAEIEKTYQPSPSSWTRFAALILSKIVVFNKRRSGETSRMTLEQYSMRPLWSEQTTEESKSAMTQFERQLAEHFVVVEIPGKRGRRVPILLSPDMKCGIDLLIKTRTLAGISSKNPYIFARSGNLLEYMRGHDCLRKCCENAGLESPENINGTKLRKYVATVTQIINLTENETDWLARHLGHDVRVHRDFYRLHESAVELTKVSRLLLAVDSGQANRFAGKKLEDIQLSDLPLLEEDLNEVAPTPFLDETNASSDNKNHDGILSSDDEIPLKSYEGKKIIKRKHAKDTTSSLHGKASVEGKKNEDTLKMKKMSKKNSKVSWTPEEINSVLTFFKLDLKKELLPGKERCTECIKTYPVLERRKWSDIKFYLKNYYTRNRRLLKK